MSLIYSKADKAAIDRAVAKARQVKPHVKPIGFGRFEVQGSEVKPYVVEFKKNAAGEFEVSCTCSANSKGGKPCYHAAACGGVFKKQVSDRAAERAAQLPTCQSCGADGFAYLESGWFCVNCIALGAADEALGLAGNPAPAPTTRAMICPECGLDNCDVPGGDDGLEYCYTCGAELPALEVA